MGLDLGPFWHCIYEGLVMLYIGALSDTPTGCGFPSLCFVLCYIVSGHVQHYFSGKGRLAIRKT